MTATPIPSVAHINAVVAGLVAAHPEAAMRIARGADLVQAGAVEPTFGGIYLVVSASRPDHAYAVIRVGDRWTCDCPDARERGNAARAFGHDLDVGFLREQRAHTFARESFVVHDERADFHFGFDPTSVRTAAAIRNGISISTLTPPSGGSRKVRRAAAP